MHIFIYHVCVNEATNNSEVRHFLLYYETYLNLDCECNKGERDKMHIYLFNMCVLMRLQKNCLVQKLFAVFYTDQRLVLSKTSELLYKQKV